MISKKNLTIALVTVLTLILIIIFSLGLTKKVEKQETAKLISYVENNNEENNEINNILKEERIIVILPTQKDNIIEKDKNEFVETQKPNPIENNKPSYVSDKKYYIKVNNEANVVTIYTKDNEGQYTVPIKAMICSTGTATPTSGIYEIKLKWEWLGLFGNVYGHYSTQIVENILFHSVPYLEKGNPASLEYWEYDKLGTSCSAGCVRLTVADAKWIYDNVEKGSLVEFYSSPEPGPMRQTICRKNIGK